MARCPCSPGTATTALGHFGARFWFCRRIWPFPQLFEAETLLRWILSTTKGWIHRFMFLHFNTCFISSHHLKKSWWILGKGTGFSSLVLVCWGDFFGFLQQYWSLFWCGKLLIPNISMWAIKKPWLSLIYRSGCAELAAACPKKVQKSEFARFLLEGILLRIHFLLTFSVCGEEKQVTSESQHPGLSDSS